MRMHLEIEFLWLLSEEHHESMAKLLDVYEDHQTLSLVMELIEGASLQKWIQECIVKNTFNEQYALKLFKPMCESLNFVHVRGIVHRDIKLDNILLQGYTYEKPIQIDSIVPKLIDFGLSTLLLQGEKSQVAVGSLAFLSPEIVKGESHDH